MDAISREEIQSFEKQYHTDHSIGDLTPTICALLGLTPPETCGGEAIASVVDHAHRLTGEVGQIKRALIYCPDAVGEKHRKLYPDLLARVEKLAGFRFLSTSVMPSVTPVCYGTIFSGASPKVHGIQKYEKPVLTVRTLFDVMADAGLNVAIVAVNGCSIDSIFRKRQVDYYSTRTDEIAFKITRKLIAEKEYDVIISYYTSYDHLSHKTGPDSAESVQALTTSVEYFEQLVADIDEHWKGDPRVAVWTPDHGNHPIDATSGAHGENIPEDMLVNHFYRLRGAEA